MAKMKFQIITPERVVYTDEIDQVTINTQDGEITVLPNHIPLVSILKSGEMILKKDNEEKSLAVAGGFLEVRDDNQIIVLADAAEKAEEIDIVRAQEAMRKAEKTMKEARKEDNVDFIALQAALDRALVRLKVGNRYRKIRQK